MNHCFATHIQGHVDVAILLSGTRLEREIGNTRGIEGLSDGGLELVMTCELEFLVVEVATVLNHQSDLELFAVQVKPG